MKSPMDSCVVIMLEEKMIANGLIIFEYTYVYTENVKKKKCWVSLNIQSMDTGDIVLLVCTFFVFPSD